MAQFPPNRSISGCENQDEPSIAEDAFQVTAPTVEHKHVSVWQELRFGPGAQKLGGAQLGCVAGRWGLGGVDGAPQPEALGGGSLRGPSRS